MAKQPRGPKGRFQKKPKPAATKKPAATAAGAPGKRAVSGGWTQRRALW